MKKSKRSKQKLPGLDKKKNLKIRQEYIDYDYIDKLSQEEKEWLNQFTEEYISGSFKKTKSGNYSSKNLHKSKKLRKDCYDRNNSRNRDLYGITKINNMLHDQEKILTTVVEKKKDTSKTNINETEDAIIELIDLNDFEST